MKDQLGREVKINVDSPQRIISLVPSQTELLFDLGLNDEIIGITKFCIHPKEAVKTKTKIGGTKKLDIEKIRSLSPTLIIANKEENTKEQIEELEKDFPVWISDIVDLQSALHMITALGKMTGKENQSEELVNRICENFAHLPAGRQGLSETKTVAYFIWNKPMMVAGKGTFINDMLSRCGFQNCFENLNGHYPEITAEQLKAAHPEAIFLSSEPFPFKDKHIEQFSELCPQSKILLVDGELFSWYGSRLLKAPEYFQKLAEKLMQ